MKINVKIPKRINIGEIKTGALPYTLPVASVETLGGIKVGENLTIDEDGTLNAEVSEVDLTDYPKKSEFKTINGNSLIGEGNIVIQGGSGGSSTESNIGNFIYAHNSEKITIKPGGYAVMSLDKMVTDTTNGALSPNENGEIVIGDGVSAILVLINMTVWQSASKYLYLQKNGESVGVKSTGSSINLTDFVCFTDVKKGDIIRSVVWNNSNNTIDIDSYVVNNYAKIIIMR